MVQDPYGVLADERVNNELDWTDIHSKEDYKRKAREYLEQTPDKYNHMRGLNLLQSPSTLDKMYEESDAIERITKQRQQELDAFRKAQILEAKRSKRSREADERKTHRRTREASKRSVASWRRGKYRRMDIKGVDTKRRSLFSQKNVITRRDVRLKNIRVDIDKIGRKHYRDSKGRYTASPFKIKNAIQR